jgi:DNA-binding CsgD family transcriptional regulator
VTDGHEGLQSRLDIVVRLLAASLVKGLTRKEAILALNAAGLAPKDVASVLGISSNQVSVTLYGARNEVHRKTKRQVDGA